MPNLQIDFTVPITLAGIIIPVAIGVHVVFRKLMYMIKKSGD